MSGTGLPRGNTKGLNLYSVTLSPASVAANISAEQTFTFTGLALTDWVSVNKPSTQAGLVIGGVRVSAANTLAITFGNLTASAITPTPSEAYTLLHATSAYNPVPTAA
jgi:hypothetical protein